MCQSSYKQSFYLHLNYVIVHFVHSITHAFHQLRVRMDNCIERKLIINVLNPHPFVIVSDNFWSAFCVFHAHFWGKTHSFKICALKKRNDFRQLKRSNFKVEKCKTEENLSKFLNNMAYNLDCDFYEELCYEKKFNVKHE